MASGVPLGHHPGQPYSHVALGTSTFTVSDRCFSNPYTGVAAIFSARHVRDIVQANLLALETDRADYQAVNVGTGRPTTIREVADMILGALGRRDLARHMLGTFREGDICHCYADITLARTLLGYEPSVRFRDGVAQLVAWVRSQNAVDRFAEAHEQLVARGLA